MLNVLPFPTMNPVLIEIGPLSIRWYALAYIVGILFGWWYARRLVANPRLWGPAGSPIRVVDLDDLVLWATIGIIVGGRAGYVLFYDLGSFLAAPLTIFEVWHGGMSFHGGFLGTVIAMILFARHRRIPVWSLIDVVAPSVTVGLCLGRIANFVNGELWGRPGDVPWAMVFPGADLQPRHPSQLYEALLEGIVLFLVLRFFTHGQHRLRQPGFISAIFAIGYALARIVSEFFREPDKQFQSAENGRVEGRRPVEVGDVHDRVAELLDLEGQTLRHERLPFRAGLGHHAPNKPKGERAHGEIAQQTVGERSGAAHVAEAPEGARPRRSLPRPHRTPRGSGPRLGGAGRRRRPQARRHARQARQAGGAAAWHPARGEGHHLDENDAHHLRLADLSRPRRGA